MKYLKFFYIMLISIPIGKAQSNEPNDLSKTDSIKYHFGFSFALNRTNYQLTPNKTCSYCDSVEANFLSKNGFNLSLVASYDFNKVISIRLMPGMHFQSTSLSYSILNDSIGTINYEKFLESTYLMIPLDIKLKTKRFHNTALYAIGGTYFATDIGHNAKFINSGTLKRLSVQRIREDYGYGLGAGIEVYRPSLKFAVEFKYTAGFKNVLHQDQSYFVEPINSIKTGSFNVSLIFESL